MGYMFQWEIVVFPPRDDRRACAAGGAQQTTTTPHAQSWPSLSRALVDPVVHPMNVVC